MFEKVQEYDPGKFKDVACKLPNLCYCENMLV